MTNHAFRGFSPELVEFLTQLRQHNDREWFNDHKSRYETEVLEPALRFVEAMATPLSRFAPRFVAVPKRVGGSLMRIYRDTRFSKNKAPYKTNVGIQFRHELRKDVHAPGYYFHIDPDDVFLGVGMWHPDAEALGRVRDAIVARPAVWKRTRDDRVFRAHFDLAGAALKRPPRGYDKDHPYIEDIKRKDFIATKTMTHDELYSPKVVTTVAQAFKSASPFMRLLCGATGAPF